MTIADLKPYQRCGESPTPGFGHVPQHWEQMRLKRVLRGRPSIIKWSGDAAVPPEGLPEYKSRLDEDQQVEFKGSAKSFVRTYEFLASVMPSTNREWEKLSIFLNLLVPKLPAPREPDPARGLLEAIDMDSYRVEKKAAMRISVTDADAEILPIPVTGGGSKPEVELDRLSNILKAFNDQFGTLFTDADRVSKRIKEDIAPKVAADTAYRNAKANTPHTARMAHDQALGKVMQVLLKDDTEIYEQFVQNPSFKRFVSDMVYALTND